MVKSIKYLLVCILCMPVAYASATRVVMDSLGRSVVMPHTPQRVVVDDYFHLFLPLFELRVPVVGTCFMNVAEGKPPAIYGLWNQFKTTGQKLAINDVCHSFDPVANIQDLNPDVYVADTDKQYVDTGTFVDRLEAFSAVYLQDTQGYDPEKPLQYQLAMAFNAMDKYNTLNAIYQRRLAQVRDILPFDPTTKSFVYAKVVRDHEKTRLFATTDNSGGYKVIRDLGFKTPDFMHASTAVEIGKNQLILLDQDIIFFTVDGTRKGTTRILHDMLETIHADWKRSLPVVIDGDTLYLDPTYTAPATFQSAMHTLDQIEWYFKR